MATKTKNAAKKTQHSNKSVVAASPQKQSKKLTLKPATKISVSKSAAKTGLNKTLAKKTASKTAKSSKVEIEAKVKKSSKERAKLAAPAAVKLAAKSEQKQIDKSEKQTKKSTAPATASKSAIKKNDVLKTNKSDATKPTNLTVIAEVVSGASEMTSSDIQQRQILAQDAADSDMPSNHAPTSLTSKGKAKTPKLPKPPKVKAEPKKKELTMKQRFPSAGTSSLDVFKGRSKSRTSGSSRSDSAPVHIDPEDVIPKEAGAQNKKWASLYEKHKSKTANAYKMTEAYEAKTPILHKLLGWGYIISNINDRLEVLFKDGVRQLISNYKAPEPIKD